MTTTIADNSQFLDWIKLIVQESPLSYQLVNTIDNIVTSPFNLSVLWNLFEKKKEEAIFIIAVTKRY